MAKIVVLVCLFFFCIPTGVWASSSRVVTVVHPVRSADHWSSPDDLKNQYRDISARGFPSTWLVQYSALLDPGVISTLRAMDQKQEIGIFLEVDDHLATDALVPYLYGQGDTARADKILLSGYSLSERKRMIDTMFSLYYRVFSRYPASVGAWYIDTFSQQYMRVKYGVISEMQCSDQYSTDGYGLWGKPWGVSYMSSSLNTLVPAQSQSMKSGVVDIQWAARDLIHAYGKTAEDSTYSVQANDYVRHRLDSAYFASLLHTYLWTDQPLSQVTVGIEVGQEGSGFSKEYAGQLDVLSSLYERKDIRLMTMSSYADMFQSQYVSHQPSYLLHQDDGDTQAFWYTSDRYRVYIQKDKALIRLKDLRWYDEGRIEIDIDDKDHHIPLWREIPSVYDDVKKENGRILWDTVSSVNPIYGQDQDGLEITMIDGSKHTIVFHTDSITFDKEKLSPPKKIAMRSSRMKQVLMRVLIYKPTYWTPSIVFAKLDQGTYVGVWISPDAVWGLSTTQPYVGQYMFPFQVIARFRSFPPKYFLDSRMMHLF